MYFCGFTDLMRLFTSSVQGFSRDSGFFPGEMSQKIISWCVWFVLTSSMVILFALGFPTKKD